VSNVIDFLERFGRDAELRHASDEDVEAALKQAGIEPALQIAIVGKDQSALERLLGADTNVCCLVNKPDDEEEEEEDDVEEEDEDEDEDEDDEDEIDDDDEDEDEDDDEDEDEDEDDEDDEEENMKSLNRVVERVA
jgi:hypothetical protein